ncbi:unnamed protein product [Bemisia tabaci]|uniref:Uncharacterized protein n=2 Tax=Bemisia tabaci TaxID=7038 RepID=A0A9P0AI64_BEMTA|nr:unnamed protein product [Bemisia tabaci]
MRPGWSLVLILCVITPLSQTEPMRNLMPWGKGKYQTLKPEKEEKPEETAATGPSEHPKTPLVHDETGPSRAPAEKLKGKEKAGKAPLPEASPAEKVPYKKLDPQKITDLDGNNPIIWGVFHPEEGLFTVTQAECNAHCMTHFGEIITKDQASIPTFEPHLINQETVCRCEMNKERIKDHFMVAEFNYTEFTEEAKKGFCAARWWLSRQKIGVRILYELGARELQPLEPKGDTGASNSTGTTDSAAGTSESGTSKVPPASPGEALDKTPKETADEPKAKKDKGKAERRPKEVIVGAFTKGGPFTDAMCHYHCWATFGQIKVRPLDRKGSILMDFTEARVYPDGKTCKCLLNTSRDFKSHYKSDYYEKLQKWCKNFFFCAAKEYSKVKGTTVFLQYETLALPLTDRDKRPETNTPAKSPIMLSPAGTPLIRTPLMTPIGSPQRPPPDETINVEIIMGDASKKFLKTKTMGYLVHGTRTKEDCQRKCDEMFGFFMFSGGNTRLHFTRDFLDRKGRCKCILANVPIAVGLQSNGLRSEIGTFFQICREKSYEAAIRFLLQKTPDFLVWMGDALSAGQKGNLAKQFPLRCKFAADPQ